MKYSEEWRNNEEWRAHLKADILILMELKRSCKYTAAKLMAGQCAAGSDLKMTETIGSISPSWLWRGVTKRIQCIVDGQAFPCQRLKYWRNWRWPNWRKLLLIMNSRLYYYYVCENLCLKASGRLLSWNETEFWYQWLLMVANKTAAC